MRRCATWSAPARRRSRRCGCTSSRSAPSCCKHGRLFPRKKTWGARYLRWLQEQRFDHPAAPDRPAGDGGGRPSRQGAGAAARAGDRGVPADLVAGAGCARRCRRCAASSLIVRRDLRGRDRRPRAASRAHASSWRYLGLVPERALDRRDGPARLASPRLGNGRVRHLLVESAWTYRHPPRIGKAKLATAGAACRLRSARSPGRLRAG